jgi:hypothetical protein
MRDLDDRFRELDDRFRELAEAGTRHAVPPGPARTRRAGRMRQAAGAGTVLVLVVLLASGVLLGRDLLGGQSGAVAPATQPTPAPSPAVDLDTPRDPGQWRRRPLDLPPEQARLRLDVTRLDQMIEADFGGRRTGRLTTVDQGTAGAYRWALQAFNAMRPLDGGGEAPVVCYWLAIEDEEVAGNCADQGAGLSLTAGSAAIPFEVYAGTVTSRADRVDAVMPEDRHVPAKVVSPDGFEVGFWTVFVPALTTPPMTPGEWNRTNLQKLLAYTGDKDQPTCQLGPHLFLVPANAPPKVETCPA